MKVYADFEELYVEDRPNYICNKYNLQVKSINSGTRYDNVKLVSITDYTRQVRKEVCEKFKDRFLATCQMECGNDTAFFSLEVLDRILDQIQD